MALFIYSIHKHNIYDDARRMMMITMSFSVARITMIAISRFRPTSMTAFVANTLR